MKLAAIAVLALVGLAVGQTIRPIPDSQVRVVGHIPAEWWTFVQVHPTTPYSVPNDRYLVVTACAPGGGGFHADAVNYDAALYGVQLGFNAHDSRLVFAPGTQLTQTTTAETKLWGYLEPVR